VSQRDWRFLYFTFRELWEGYSTVHPIAEVGRAFLLRAIKPRYARRQLSQEVTWFTNTIDLDRDWQNLETLRAVSQQLGSLGFTPHTSAESVYQTAIQVVTNRIEDEPGEERRWFYRGQRDCKWPALPGIFRALPSDATAAVNELQARIERTRRAVASLQRSRIGSTQLECLAIAQHYSDVFSIKTWLVDVTESPWAALFFASDGGRSGEVGAIEYVSRSEWRAFGGSETESFGAIRYVSPGGVQRIKNQSAFFIDTPHPELYRQLVSRRLYFQQTAGVVFEDESLPTPVTRAQIYPDPDDTIARFSTDFETLPAEPLAREPTRTSLEPPSADVFFEIARPWLNEATVGQTDLIYGLCSLHAEVTRRRDKLPRYVSTLYHFGRVVDFVLTFPDDLEQLLLYSYVNHLEHPNTASGDHGNIELAKRTFLECVRAAQPQWLSAAERAMETG
jgi:hypothetical protein